jgi:hypothetical protein
MVVRMVSGRGRSARWSQDRRTGGLLFRVFMAWFGRGDIRAD